MPLRRVNPNRSEIENGLAVARLKGIAPVDYLLKQAGFSEEGLADGFAEWKKIPRVKIASLSIDPELGKLITEKVALKHQCLPLNVECSRLVMAMANPADYEAIQEVEFASGFTVQPVVATRTEILDGIAELYHTDERMQEFLSQVSGTEDFSILSEDPDKIDLDHSDSRNAVDQVPVVKMCNLILQEALRCQASDVHLEPALNCLQVRMRVDGVLREYIDVPKWLNHPLVSRIKILASLDIAERRLPQDGRFKIKLLNKSADVRVSTLPALYGEKVVMRVLGASTLPTLESMELSESQLSTLTDCLSQPQGMILLTGPTGNGMVRRRSLEVVECGARRHLMKIYALGIDLGKTVFHLVGLDASGQMVVRKRCSRAQLLAFTANLQVQLIGMEACSGSHFLGRALRAQGHEVRLMPAQYVKPYVKTNKSDYIDAEAIAEAVQRPRMRFVPIKTEEQLDLQALHRVRERWVMRRTAVVNQIRSLLLERGLTLPKGRSHLDEQLPRILEDAELNLSDSFRVLLAQLKLELEQLAARIEEMDRVIQKTARENEACQRLTEIPGVGPVTATALIAAVGNASAFAKGRMLSAWMGIVPGEYTTGGKQKLLGISKRGNKYLRRLFVQGARSVLQQRHRQAPGLRDWLAQLLGRTHQNVVVVALANKLVRMAWAVLCKNERYRAPVLAMTN